MGPRYAGISHSPLAAPRRLFAAHPEVVHGVIEESSFEVRGLAQEATGRDHLIDDEFGLIGGKIETLFLGDDAESVKGGLGDGATGYQVFTQPSLGPGL